MSAILQFPAKQSAPNIDSLSPKETAQAIRQELSRQRSRPSSSP